MEGNDSAKTTRDQAVRDIETIKSFLERGQQSIEDSGTHFIMWGLIIPAGFFLFPLVLKSSGEESLAVRAFWPILCGLGGLASVIIGKLTARKDGGRSYADKVSTALWVGHLSAIAALFVAAIVSGNGFSPFFLSSVAAILGIAYWVYGNILSLRWFSRVSFVWWAAAAAIGCMDLPRAALTLSAATFAASFIPGCALLMRKRAKGR